MFVVTLTNTGATFNCDQNQNVLQALERLGYKGIPIGCRGGGCGVCKVRVVAGRKYRLGKISNAQVSTAERRSGYALACKLVPEENLTLEVCGQMRYGLEKGIVGNAVSLRR